MNKKILLVLESDKFLKVVVEDKLSAAGYEVNFVEHPHTCIDQVEKWCPDLLIIDILFQDGTGLEIIREVHSEKIEANPKIIAFYDPAHHDRDELRNYGVSEYLLKASFTLDEMLEKVNKILLS